MSLLTGDVRRLPLGRQLEQVRSADHELCLPLTLCSFAQVCTSGRLFAGMEARLLDECGEIVHVPANHGGGRVVSRVGEIWIRGATLFSGYCEQGRLLRGDFASDSFFRTGDVGCWDSLRYLTVVDRAKDMVLVGGENVYCAEVESVLADHPSVSQVAVFAAPNDVMGEMVAGA